MNAAGKFALVTGSSKRLGREIAIELGRRGARVAIHHRSSDSEAEALETLRRVREAGSDGHVLRAELRSLNEIDAMFSAIHSKFGMLHILINSASVFAPAAADETSEHH